MTVEHDQVEALSLARDLLHQVARRRLYEQVTGVRPVDLRGLHRRISERFGCVSGLSREPLRESCRQRRVKLAPRDENPSRTHRGVRYMALAPTTTGPGKNEAHERSESQSAHLPPYTTRHGPPVTRVAERQGARRPVGTASGTDLSGPKRTDSWSAGA